MIADAQSGRPVRHSLDLQVPLEFLKSYDRAIAMLEMSLEEEVLLDEADFTRYVMNEWEWRANYAASTTAYLMGGK